MAKLAHPNVAAVFDVGTHEGDVFLAMELIDGTPSGGDSGVEKLRGVNGLDSAFSLHAAP